MTDSYDHMSGTEMDVSTHPDNSHQFKNIHDQGVAVLKNAMSNTVDPTGKDYPNTTHYPESQMATMAISDIFRK